MAYAPVGAKGNDDDDDGGGDDHDDDDDELYLYIFDFGCNVVDSTCC